jgi:hypothetical protein
MKSTLAVAKIALQTGTLPMTNAAWQHISFSGRYFQPFNKLHLTPSESILQQPLSAKYMNPLAIGSPLKSTTETPT